MIKVIWKILSVAQVCMVDSTLSSSWHAPIHTISTLAASGKLIHGLTSDLHLGMWHLPMESVSDTRSHLKKSLTIKSRSKGWLKMVAEQHGSSNTSWNSNVFFCVAVSSLFSTLWVAKTWYGISNNADNVLFLLSETINGKILPIHVIPVLFQFYISVFSKSFPLYLQNVGFFICEDMYMLCTKWLCCVNWGYSPLSCWRHTVWAKVQYLWMNRGQPSWHLSKIKWNVLRELKIFRLKGYGVINQTYSLYLDSPEPQCSVLTLLSQSAHVLYMSPFTLCLHLACSPGIHWKTREIYVLFLSNVFLQGRVWAAWWFRIREREKLGPWIQLVMSLHPCGDAAEAIDRCSKFTELLQSCC